MRSSSPYADLLDRVRGAEALNMDETGWRLKGAQRALWGAFTERHAVFAIASSRHEDHARDLLADSTAIVTSDRWWAYGHLPLKRRQVCRSHLQRDFAAHADGLAAEKDLGEAGLRVCEELFWAWEIYAHTGDRAELKRRTRKLRRELKPILTRHAAKAARYRHGRGFARNLLKVWPALWTFDSIDRVQPINNHPERGLRGAVIYRKLSLGSQSEDGERRIERLLSAHTTCRLQRRSVVVVAVLLRIDQQIQRLEKRVAAQDERIVQLDRRIARSSRNSSQPPSGDPPSASPKRSKDRSGRKQGAHDGHEGKGRSLLPAWAVNEVVEHWPAGCGCGHVFGERDRVSVGRPARHQVEELPVMAVTITEHRCQRERCPGCGQTSNTPTSSTCSPPTPAAPRFQRSPNPLTN